MNTLVVLVALAEVTVYEIENAGWTSVRFIDKNGEIYSTYKVGEFVELPFGIDIFSAFASIVFSAFGIFSLVIDIFSALGIDIFSALGIDIFSVLPNGDTISSLGMDIFSAFGMLIFSALPNTVVTKVSYDLGGRNDCITR